MRILITLAASSVLLIAGCKPSEPAAPKTVSLLGQTGWTWVREDAQAWKAEGDALRLRALPGSLWEKENTCRNVLVKALPDGAGDVAVAVTVTSLPVVQAEQAGLLLYGDDDHYVKLIREFTDGARQAVMVIEDGTKLAVVGEKKKLPEGEKTSLRLVRKGGKLTGQYQDAAGAWQEVGTCDAPTWVKVALFAHGAPPPETDRWAAFSGLSIAKPEP